VVRERVPEVIERVIQFRRSVLAGMPISGANPALLTSAQDQSVSQQDEPQPEGWFRG
jgi:hypothetical protein